MIIGQNRQLTRVFSKYMQKVWIQSVIHGTYTDRYVNYDVTDKTTASWQVATELPTLPTCHILAAPCNKLKYTYFETIKVPIKSLLFTQWCLVNQL